MHTFNTTTQSPEPWSGRILLPTYRVASIDPFVAAVTADAPFFLIEGSATKVVTVKRIILSGFSLTAVAYIAMNVVKYSTAASGGTATSAPLVPLDSSFAPATASLVKYYTAAPTPGTTVGNIATRRPLLQATTAAAAGIPPVVVFDFSDMPHTNGVVLRGVAQGLGVEWPVAPASAVTLSAEIEWTEES